MEKVVILARGLGTRMRREDESAGLSGAQARVAETGVKALMPLDRPFLDYVLSAVADAGLHHVCLVVGPEHTEVRRYYGSQVQATRLSIEFAEQRRPLGTADAVVAAADFAAGGSFLVLNSDNYYPTTALTELIRLEGPGLVSFNRRGMLVGSNIPEERLRRFALVDTDPCGLLRRIVEKPEPKLMTCLPESVGVSMNCWRFDAGIFAACRAIDPSPRGELEITTAVQYAIDELGASFHVIPCNAPVLDLSSRQDVAPVSVLLRGVEVRL